MRIKIGLGLFLVLSTIFIATLLFLQPKAKIGDTNISLTIAKTPDQQARGLSNVKKLDSSSGMLFVYEDEQIIDIWMKDMFITIDVIWIDEDQRVVHIVNNMSPESYPAQYSNQKPAKYVLETHDSVIEQESIELGDYVELNL